MNAFRNNLWMVALTAGFLSMGLLAGGCGPTGGGNENDNVVENENDNIEENTNDNVVENENDNVVENENVNENVNDNIEPVNTAPVADAGSDQSVAGGSTVQLDASASSDADGDTLSFAWEQLPAATVTLTGANTATPTFEAPNEDATLEFQVTVSDGELTAAATVQVTVSQVFPPTLFIANFDGDNITSYANPSTVNGNIPPTTNLAGVQTGITDPADIIVTVEQVLIVSNFALDSLTSYVNATETNGNLEPDGNVTGTATRLDDPTSLTVNTGEDLIFVANIASNEVTVYANASDESFNGNQAPIRTIFSLDISNPVGINFGANDELYVANATTDEITVFANASNLNGTIDATRIIQSTEFNDVFDVFVDENDTMFVVDSFDGEIYIFDDASSLNGLVTPDFILTVPGAGLLTALVIDSQGVGYIADFANDQIVVYDDIATLNGTLTPDRVINGSQTQLNGPIRLFLLEE